MLPLAALLLFAAATPARGQDTVTVEPGPAAVEAGEVKFTFKRSSASASVPTVKYSLEQEGHWVAWAGTTTAIPGGQSEKTLTIPVTVNDSIDQPNGSVTLRLKSGDGYVVGSPGAATVVVADDDPTSVALSAAAGDIEEGESKTLTVTLGRALVAGEKLAVALTFGGTAGFGVDYSLSAPDPAPEGVAYENLSSTDLATKPPGIVFTGGTDAADKATLILEGSADRVLEPSETVSVGLGTLTAGEGLGGGAKAAAGGVSFSIDDATKIEVSIEAAATPVTEGADAAFTLTADLAPTADLTVDVALAWAGDYLKDGARSKNVVIKRGATTAGLALATVGDAVDEYPGSVTAAIRDGAGYVAAPTGDATVDIRDDDPTTVTLEVTDDEAVELTHLQPGEFRVTIGRPLRLAESLSVPLLFSGTTPRKIVALEANAVSDTVVPPSFDAATDTLTFRPGGANKSGGAVAEFRVRLTTTDDNAVDDTIVLDIPKSSTGTPRLEAASLQGGATGARIGDGEIVVLDLEAKRTFRISGGAAVDEGGTAKFTVSANRKTARNTLVNVDVTQEGDFAAASSLGRKQVRVAALATSGTLNVATVGDEKDEAHGRIVATIAGANHYEVAAAPNDSAAVTVNDDDDPPPSTPVAKFSTATATVGEAGGSTTVDIAFSPTPAAELTLKYTLSGSATQGGDYTIAGASDGAGTLTVAKDAATASIAVAIADDALGEGDETVILSLADGTGYSVGTPGSCTLTIDDDEPALTIAAAAATVAEGTAAAFMVTADRAVATEVEVGVAVTAGGDFVAAGDLGARTVAIARGERTASLSVPTANDDADEADGWVRATLRTGAAYTIPKPPNDSAAVTVTDDDGARTPPSVTLSAAPNPVTEGGTVAVTVSLSRTLSSAVTIPLILAAGTAEAGDYGSLAPVVVAAGRRTGASRLATVKDADAEDEILTVSLGALPPEVRPGTPSRVTLRIAEATTGGPGGGPPTPPPEPPPPPPEPPPPPPPPPGPGPSPGGPLQAAFVLDRDCEDDPCRVRTGEPVGFRDASTGTVRSRLWDFGDGRSSRAADPLHAWRSPGFHEVVLTVGDGAAESRAAMTFLVEAAQPAGTCASGAATRCLRDSRFQVEADWFLDDGGRGAALVVPAGTNDSGLFRFFDPANWEILVKVLDGCEHNGALWVFAASTTDVGYAIRVTDTVTKQVREYRNEPGTPAAAVTDAKAFPESCEGS